MRAAWVAAIAALIVAVPVAARLVLQMVNAGSPWKRRDLAAAGVCLTCCHFLQQGPA